MLFSRRNEEQTHLEMFHYITQVDQGSKEKLK